VAGFLKIITATYLAGAFFDAFLLFFGFAVALFMVSHLSLGEAKYNNQGLLQTVVTLWK
jgi:hypothetical protein